MLTFLADYAQHFGPLNLFRYLTVRAGGAFLTSFIFVLFYGPRVIAALRIKQGKGQPIRADGPQTHLAKRGTPTMGGLMILSGTMVASLLWVSPRGPYPYAWIALLVMLGFGLIGFYDDYLKVTKQSHKGFSGMARLACEFFIAGMACWAMTRFGAQNVVTSLAIPFFSGFLIDLGLFFLVFGALVIVGAGNAVNLTDGLDGLAIVPVMIAAGAFALIAYLSGNAIYATYLGINFVPGTGELAVVCGAVIGAGAGFLWFNAPPAQIFMGDTGSLAMGGLLGTIAVATKHEIVLGIVGGLFVLEAMSVIIQVGSFKLTGKRVFRMAPIHHHFEQLGWSEPQVVVRFWIIAFVLALIGLATLKVR